MFFLQNPPLLNFHQPYLMLICLKECPVKLEYAIVGIRLKILSHHFYKNFTMLEVNIACFK